MGLKKISRVTQVKHKFLELCFAMRQEVSEPLDHKRARQTVAGGRSPDLTPTKLLGGRKVCEANCENFANNC